MMNGPCRARSQFSTSDTLVENSAFVYPLAAQKLRQDALNWTIPIAYHSVQSAATALGGEVSGRRILCPGPGHSAADRSLSVWLDPLSSEGFSVHSFSGDDPITCRDYVRSRLGLPPFKPGRRISIPAHPQMAGRPAGLPKPTGPQKAPEAPKPFNDAHLARQGYGFVCSYDYTDRAGNTLYQVLRYEHPQPPEGVSRKSFLQRRPDGSGGWFGRVSDVAKVPYRLADFDQHAHDLLFVTEGEKDADRLTDLGFRATTVASGLWTADAVRELAGYDVFVLEDNDQAGREKAEKAAAALHGVASAVRIVRLPDLPERGDVSDWLDADPANAMRLLPIAQAAPLWKPVAKEEAPKAVQVPTKTDSPTEDLPEIVTQDAVALQFAATYKDALRYDHKAGRWYEWTGTHWKADEQDRALQYARELARRSARPDAPRDMKEVGKVAFASGVERFSRADPRLSVTADMWDSDPYLLGTPAGTVDLRTGRLREPDPGDGITKVTAVGPTSSAGCPRWLQFLHETTGGDPEMIRFLQQWGGYCLTGDTRQHALLFVYGPGGNGKSVFLNVLSGILGGYATTAAMDTFTASIGDRHPTDLAMLRGARLVTASETEEGRAWAESRIKTMTGGDKITARFMRQDFFEYVPQFKLTIVGNHKPSLHNVDEAARRRFRIAPFVRKPMTVDPMLDAKLREEFPAILAWLIEGCLDWQANGLSTPKAIVDETQAYFDSQDILGQWIEECCDSDPGNRWKSETSTDLFSSWRDFAMRAGEREGSRRSFGETMQRRGYSTKKGTGGTRLFEGIRLKPTHRPFHEAHDE